MNKAWLYLAIAAVLAVALPVSASTITTVTWGASSTSGTLGSITVSYTTVVAGNAGMTFTDNWNTSTATAPAGPYSSQSAGILGTNSTSPQTETISFSSAITNPILLVNYSDPLSVFNFGTLPIAFLSSNNAQLSGDTVTFTGSGNTANDGFAAQITGTFGPGTSLTFTESTTSGAADTVGFTIGTVTTSSTPEPASIFLGGLAMLGMAVVGKRLKRGSVH